MRRFRICAALFLFAFLSAPILWLPSSLAAQEGAAPGTSQGVPQAPPAPAAPAQAAPAAPAEPVATIDPLDPPADANGYLSAILKPQRLDESDDKIEIVYFFWYGCPSCFKTDPATSMFLSSLPDDVRVVKVHVLFDEPPYWRIHGKLFYTLDELGVEKDLHTKIFETVQTRTASPTGHYTRTLLTPEAQETFAAAHGVSRAAFKAAYDSPAVKGRMERVIKFMENSNIDGVPAFVINGRYQYSFFNGPGFYAQADKLIATERARLAAEKTAAETPANEAPADGAKPAQ